MPILSAANLQSYTDHLATAWEALSATAGSTADATPVFGTVRNLMANLVSVPVSSNDIDVESDLDAVTQQAYLATGVETTVGWLATALRGLELHCRSRALTGQTQGLAGYLTYLNTTPTGSRYAALLAPGFQDLFAALNNGNLLPTAGFFHRGISPSLNPTLYPNGMGRRAVGGSLAAGSSPNLTRYAEITPLAVVITDFSGGSAPPTVTLAGTDDGGLTSTTWTATLTGNNPLAAVSTTITPSTTAQGRQTVAVGSTTGIVAGSVLTVNAGLSDQEVVVAETVAGGNVTAVFAKAHNAGAVLTGNATYPLTPSVAGARMRALSNITLGLASHAAGAVRVEGRQERGWV